MPQDVASWIERRFIDDSLEQYVSRSVAAAEPGSPLHGHLKTVTDSLEPAPKQAIVILLTRLAAHYWSERGEGQWKIIFEDYANDLGKYPLDLLEHGISRYRASGKFWPKVSELLEKVEPLYRKRKLQHARLCKLCGVTPLEQKKPKYLDCLRAG